MLPHLTNGWPPLGDGQRGLASLLSRLTPQDANSYFVCVLNTQRAPDTRWGSIVGHRGVLEIFVCLVLFFLFFLSAYFFLCTLLLCFWHAVHWLPLFVCVSQPLVPLDCLGWACSRPVHCPHRRSRMRIVDKSRSHCVVNNACFIIKHYRLF